MNWEEIGRPVSWEAIERFRTSHFRAVRKPLLRLQAWRVMSRANAHKDLTSR